MASSLPFMVRAADFAEARVEDIDAFESAFGAVKPNIETYVRKRTRSFKKRKLSFKIRQQQAIVNSKRVKIAEDKRSRKHKRIPRLLRQKIVRGNPPYWLPTHLWQVRHMHVQKIWGWVLPYCHQSRRVRAASRAEKQYCTIHDASYYSCIEVSGQEDKIRQTFQKITDPGESSFGNNLFLSGGYEGYTVIYHVDKFPMHAIGPVFFQWRPKAMDSHERALSETWAAFIQASQTVYETNPHDYDCDSTNMAIQLKNLRGKFARFELRGSKAHALLSNILQANNESTANKHFEQDSIWAFLQQKKTPNGFVPMSAILSLMVRDPRKYGGGGSTLGARARRCIVESKFGIPEDRSLSLSEELHQYWVSGKAACSPLLDKEKRRQFSKLKLDQATIDLGKKAARIKLKEACFNVDFRPTVGKASDCEKMNSESEVYVPVILIRRIEDGSWTNPSEIRGACMVEREGWDLIVPWQYAMSFWIAAQYAGARAIGLFERRMCMLASGLPCFPQDFPDTLSSEEYWSDIETQKLKKDQRKPASKKPNYEKLNTPTPFRPKWTLVLDPNEIMDGDSQNESTNSPIDGTFLQESPHADSKNEAVNDVQLSVPVEPIQSQASDFISIRQNKSELQCCVVRNPKYGKPLLPQWPSPNHHSKSKSRTKGSVWIPRKKQVEESGNELLQLLQFPTLVVVRIVIHGRGTLKENAMICAPLAQDILPSLVPSLKLSHLTMQDLSTLSKESFRSRSETEDTKYLTRRIVGYVTTGGLSYMLGRSVGIGFVSASLLLKEVYSLHARPPTNSHESGRKSSVSWVWVVVRNCTSNQYRLARMYILAC